MHALLLMMRGGFVALLDEAHACEHGQWKPQRTAQHALPNEFGARLRPAAQSTQTLKRACVHACVFGVQRCVHISFAPRHVFGPRLRSPRSYISAVSWLHLSIWSTLPTLLLGWTRAYSHE